MLLMTLKMRPCIFYLWKIWAFRGQWLSLARQLRGPQLSSRKLYRYCWDKARQGEGPEAAPKLTRGREPHGSTHRSPHLGNQRGTRRNTRARDLGNEGLLAFWVPEKLSEVLTAKQNMPPPFCSRAEVGSAYRYAAEVGRAQVRVVTSWAELKLSGWALLSSSLGERCAAAAMPLLELRLLSASAQALCCELSCKWFQTHKAFVVGRSLFVTFINVLGNEFSAPAR